MELNINRDIIKWNKLWAKDNQYTSICCLQAQKKLIWIDNVPNLSFPSSATTMMMMLTFVSLFKKFESVPELLLLVSSAVCRGSVCQALSLVSLRAVRAHLETEAHRLEILESQGGGHNNRRQKKYILQNKYKALGAKIASALELAYVV